MRSQIQIGTSAHRQLWLPDRASSRRRLTPKTRAGPPRCAYPSGMQPRRHRMRRQARRESARAWIASGAAVTIKAYTRRYGAGRYTACEDLAAIGFPLPDSAQRWAHRPLPQPRPPRSATSRALPDNDWIMMDGRPYFVAGYTPGGAPYGIYLDEMDDDYLTGMITPGGPGKLSGLDLSGT
jgi:hypothetical protein